MTTAFLTAVALFGAGIAYFQWLIVRRRTQIALLECRIAAYERLKAPIGDWLSAGKVPGEKLREFSEAINVAQPVFGNDVSVFLSAVREDLDRFDSFGAYDDPLTEEQSQERSDTIHRLSRFSDELEKRVVPYMRGNGPAWIGAQRPS